MERNHILRKGLVLGIILLFIGTSITPSTAQNIEKPALPSAKGNILYVGGSGPGNYTKIQDAIDNTSDSDTVYVYNGTFYEHVTVNKAIHLIGEEKNSTIIDGGGSNDVINVTVDGIYIESFSIIHSGGSPSWYNAGIQINSNYTSISNCLLWDDYVGIYVNRFCSNCTIVDNHIFDNEFDGILISFHADYIAISNNIIYNNSNVGISLGQKNNFCSVYENKVYQNAVAGISGCELEKSGIINNNVSDNHIGLCFGRCFYNWIRENNVYNNILYGIELHSDSANNTITDNNFVSNMRNNAYVWENPGWNDWGSDTSGGNYWSDYSGKDGYHGYNQDTPGPDGLGDTPYNISHEPNQNISNETNQDRYPLMFPYGWPFQPIFLGYVEMYFEKDRLGSSGWGTTGGLISRKILQVNTNLDELLLKIVLYFTVEMNYSLRFPFALSPLIAYGLQIMNYSDYSWNTMKLKHHGYWIWNENVSQEIYVHPKNFKKGDELQLYLNISGIHVPGLNSPGNIKSWEKFLRIAYNLPVIHKLLLHNWVLPILAPYNMIFHEPIPAIVLRFQ